MTIRTSCIAMFFFAFTLACAAASSEFPIDALRTMAEQGDPKAQYNLSKAYFSGKGIPKNQEAGLRWLIKAAESGSASAQGNLGFRYSNGKGLPQNLQEAAKWYAKAADSYRRDFENGDANAGASLARMYSNGEGVGKDLEQALKLYKRAAELGDAYSQDQLGGIYQRGEGVPADAQSSSEWYRKAADSYRKAAVEGDARAQSRLGFMYLFGLGVPSDINEEVKWSRMAAAQEDISAMMTLADILYRGSDARGNKFPRNPVEAAQLYLKLDELNESANTENRLGEMCRDGVGLPKNAEKALAWFKKASAKGNAAAYGNLALLYETGTGVEKDQQEAARWYGLAEDTYRKQAEAIGPIRNITQYLLGKRFQKGDGVRKDMSEAVKWLRLAADQEVIFAQESLGDVYSTGDGVPINYSEALKWYRIAAEGNSASSQCRLGAIYQQGNGVPKNMDEAVKWYHLSAEQGYAQAQFILGLIYDDGDGVSKDITLAIKWYRLAADQGNADAQCNLGKIYFDGNGVPVDYLEAGKWYHLAAEHGLAAAQYTLGVIYQHGRGVKQDTVEAASWYRKAAEQGYADAQQNLGVMYIKGTGVLKDEVEALAWFNVSAASGNSEVIKNRDALEGRLSSEAKLAAQQRAKEILGEIEKRKAGRKITQVMPAATVEFATPPKSSGSGAIVSTQGHVLTAAHVVIGASSVRVVTARGTWPATVLQIDESNDVAILKVGGGPYIPIPVASSSRIRLGQMVATIGFPNIGIQGFSPKVTRGEISSLNGIADDPRSWQISAPVQPGNSGGPLLDENGNLIGVVVAKLGLKAAKVIGDVPQNVNYAVKSAYALALLEPYLADITPELKLANTKPSFEDMVFNAQQSVVLILCY